MTINNDIPYSEYGPSFIGESIKKCSEKMVADIKKKVDEAYEKGKADAIKGCLDNSVADKIDSLVNEYTHKWSDEFSEVNIGIIKKGRGFIYPEALIEVAKKIRLDAREISNEHCNKVEYNYYKKCFDMGYETGKHDAIMAGNINKSKPQNKLKLKGPGRQSDIDYKKCFDMGYETGHRDAIKDKGEKIQMRADGTVEFVHPQTKQVGSCAISEGGLTKREYFAAMALQGVLVNAGRNGLEFRGCAKEAVLQADALIKELKKTHE